MPVYESTGLSTNGSQIQIWGRILAKTTFLSWYLLTVCVNFQALPSVGLAWAPSSSPRLHSCKLKDIYDIAISK